ncbi:MAG: riboflavin biosynthesis protein RibF [Clostridia bacterium]|nr:riboflavin biosynthesis protein RibF [Clostridia bacterium]
MEHPICISLRTLQPCDPPAASVLCLGNFDGVHKAHQALFQKALALRDEKAPGAACSVFCFSLPSSLYLSMPPVPQLCDTEEKLRLFASYGMEYAFLADFPKVQPLSPAEFVQSILLFACHCVGAVCGFNYRFGACGAGTAQTLKDLLPFPVEVQSEVLEKGETVSSTRIRALLQNGEVEAAAELLSRPYFFTAPVIHGKGLGRNLGAPTINQQIPQNRLIPRHGVYLTDCKIGDLHYKAVSNVGLRPTVENSTRVNCESFLLDFTGDLYEKTVTVSFLKWIRPEIRFSSQEELQAQIQRDIQTAQEI